MRAPSKGGKGSILPRPVDSEGLFPLVTQKPNQGLFEFRALEGILEGDPAKEAEIPRKGHSEEQIVFALKQAENGAKIP